MFKTLKRILKICGKHQKRVWGGIVCSLFNAVFRACTIIAILIILLNIRSLSKDVILTALWIQLAGMAGQAFMKYLMNMFLSASGYIVFTDKRLEFGDKLKKAPMGYFSKQNLGTITNALTNTMSELDDFCMMAVENVIGGIIQALVSSIVILCFNRIIGIICIAGLALAVLVLNAIQNKSGKLVPFRNKAMEKTVTAVLEFVQGISVIKSFGRKNNGSIADAFTEYADSCITLEKGIMGVSGLFNAVLDIFSALIMTAAGLLTITGRIDFGYGMMFITSAFIIYGQAAALGNGAFLMQLLGDAFDRLDRVFDIPEMESKQIPVPKDNCALSVRHVDFAYDSRKVIDDVSVDIPQNSSCAIVGYSGSGKTTLCNLIVRFWDVDKGTISFGGNNIKDYNPDELMNNFSMVFQNVYLFNDTIASNIKFGCPDATEDQVIEAAKRAQCHDFISVLPDGYNTVIGEGGNTLSGGEKQRISIARAILKDAPVVILDEATSSVDPENEFELISALHELTKGKTLISIAHRMSTVKHADQIVVMQEGRIVQKGTHSELVKRDGVYKRFLELRKESAGWSISA